VSFAGIHSYKGSLFVYTSKVFSSDISVYKSAPFRPHTSLIPLSIPQTVR